MAVSFINGGSWSNDLKLLKYYLLYHGKFISFIKKIVLHPSLEDTKFNISVRSKFKSSWWKINKIIFNKKIYDI